MLAYSPTDTLVLPAVITAFATAAGMTAVSITAASGHDDTTFDFNQFINFINKNNLG
jgi:hypothetical protein